MDRTILTLIGLSVVVVGTGVLVCRKRRSGRREPKASEQNVDERHECAVCEKGDYEGLLKMMMASLEKKALAYAVYREALKRGLGKSAKEALYEKYGYVNLPPNLEENEVFARCPELMADSRFLTSLNNWLLRHGGKEKDGFFDASIEAGRVLVEASREKVRQIVDDYV